MFVNVEELHFRLMRWDQIALHTVCPSIHSVARPERERERERGAFPKSYRCTVLLCPSNTEYAL